MYEAVFVAPWPWWTAGPAIGGSSKATGAPSLRS
jgi:hypothetical protein